VKIYFSYKDYTVVPVLFAGKVFMCKGLCVGMQGVSLMLAVGCFAC